MKKRVCAFSGCLTPDVLLLVDGPRNGAVKFHPGCRRLKELARQAEYRAGSPGRTIYNPADVDASEPAEEIEANYRAALAAIKQRPRELVLGWESPLARVI